MPLPSGYALFRQAFHPYKKCGSWCERVPPKCSSARLFAFLRRPLPLPANMLKGLAKTRHPAAKSVTQTPAKQEVTKKRSCNAGKPISICTNEEEDAFLYKGASALAALRNGPTKKQRSAKGPRALPLRPMSTCNRHGEAARAQSPTRHRRLKSITSFSSQRWHNAKESFGSANQSHQLRPVPSYSAST